MWLANRKYALIKHVCRAVRAERTHAKVGRRTARSEDCRLLEFAPCFEGFSGPVEHNFPATFDRKSTDLAASGELRCTAFELGRRCTSWVLRGTAQLRRTTSVLNVAKVARRKLRDGCCMHFFPGEGGISGSKEFETTIK